MLQNPVTRTVWWVSWGESACMLLWQPVLYTCLYSCIPVLCVVLTVWWNSLLVWVSWPAVGTVNVAMVTLTALFRVTYGHVILPLSLSLSLYCVGSASLNFSNALPSFFVCSLVQWRRDYMVTVDTLRYGREPCGLARKMTSLKKTKRTLKKLSLSKTWREMKFNTMIDIMWCQLIKH